MKEESQNPRTDLELEERIAALVLGEASPTERDELNQLVEERPDLATLKAEFESVHALLCDVATAEYVAEDDDWKLAAEKRSRVIAVIGGDVDEPSSTLVTLSNSQRRWPSRSQFWGSLTKIAAVFCVAGFFGLLAISSFVNPERQLASTAKRPANAAAALDLGWIATGGGLIENERRVVIPDLAEREGVDYTENSTTSLSAIRDSIGAAPTLPTPYYLNDDVQHFEADADSKLQSQQLADLGFDLGELEWDSGRVPDIAALALRSQTPQLGDDLVPSYRFSRDESWFGSSGPTDARSAGRGFRADGLVENSQGLADSGGESGGGGAKAVDALGSNLSAAQQTDELARQEFSKWAVEQQLATPAQSVVAGLQGNAQEQAHDAIALDLMVVPEEPAGRVKGLADKAAGHADPKGYFSKESSVVSNLESLLIPQGLNADGSSQMEAETPPKEVGDLQAGQSRPGGTWRYETLGKKGRQLQELNRDAVATDDDNDTDTDWERLQPQREERLRELPQSGSVANEGWSESAVVRYQFEDSSPTRRELTRESVALSGLNETSAAEEAFSTFSLHVSDVSFKLAQAALARGEWPAAAKVRIEEFINAFDYGDPLPNRGEQVSCRVEQAIHPFLQQRNLLRVSMRTAAAGRSSDTPLRLTLLLDNSGSMERRDRQQTVRRAFALLAQQLTPIDQVTLISFARQPRLLADKVSGAQAQQLVQAIEDLPSEGGTNIEAALRLAFEKAQEQHADDAQNRIVLLTDGAVNLGDADPASLSRMIASMRDAGIAFDAAGISAEGLNDEVLEALTRKGDGRYYLLDTLESADDGFARQIAGALRPSAKNVKVQIEFNPQRVGRYKLLGFEKHLLKQEDFRDDTVDAAEMAAAEAGVAVYQFEAKPDGEGDVGSVSVRFRDLSTGQMTENRWPIPFEAHAPLPDEAAPSLRIAISAALFAAKLRGEAVGETVELKTLSGLISGLPDRDRNAKRIQQLQNMIEQARQISGN